MFTGLIESTGSIVSVKKRDGSQRITIKSAEMAAKLHTGDSVAVSGVCLTALDIGSELFHADLAAETVARTSLTALTSGSEVNLELPTPAEIQHLRTAGEFVGRVLEATRDAAAVGVNLLELDALAHDMIRREGAESCYID